MRSETLPQGYLVYPEHGGEGGAATAPPRPGVVMIHDVWGLADHTRDMARRLAAESYGVLAVDLYRRNPPEQIDNPGAWMRELRDPEVLADLQEAVDLLATHPAVAGAPIAMTGFCMGGLYTLLAASHCRGLAAAVAYYGLLSYQHGLLAPPAGEELDRERKPRDPLEAAPDICCPVLGLFGAEDEFVPVSEVRELERRLAAAPHAAEVIVYPGAGHAFANDTRPTAYHAESARDAWQRMLAWFDTYLRRSEPS